MKKNAVYMHGYNCGKNGPNEINCHFSLFSTTELTRAWERGKRDAEAGIAPGRRARGVRPTAHALERVIDLIAKPLA